HVQQLLRHPPAALTGLTLVVAVQAVGQQAGQQVGRKDDGQAQEPGAAQRNRHQGDKQEKQSSPFQPWAVLQSIHPNCQVARISRPKAMRYQAKAAWLWLPMNFSSARTASMAKMKDTTKPMANTGRSAG